MADILHDFPINASSARVFEAFATPAGLERWWTLGSAGTPKLGGEHFRISSYCWAMYLRVLKRGVEFGEAVPYKDRLNV